MSIAIQPRSSRRILRHHAGKLGMLFVSPCMLLSFQAHAENPSLSSLVDATSLEQLGELVVTDTKLPQSADSVTQKIVVLHSDDIDASPLPNRNLAELMRMTSGQFVNVLSRSDANWGSYGGLGPKYNSYLLDGLPIDSFVDPMSLDIDAIERVEIHKGPASVLYSNYLTMDFSGNEAPLAGTTNFVLKNRIDKPLTRLSLGAGSWGTYAGSVYHQGSSGALSYSVGVRHESADYTQYGNAGSWLQTVDHPDYRKTQVFANLNYALGAPDHTLSLFVHHTEHSGDMGRPHRDFDHRYEMVNVAYNNRLSDHWHLQFKIGERLYERGFANDDYPTSLAFVRYETTHQDIRPMDLTLNWLHGDNSVLTVGIDHQQVHYWTDNRNASGQSQRDNDARATSTGYFVQEKFHWRDWVMRAGVRHNDIEQDYERLGGIAPTVSQSSWHKNLWSTGLRYNLSSTLALYGNAGSSFMVPAAKQIGGTVSSPSASGELANPGLRAENGIGRDLGIDWQTTPALNLGLRLFFNSIDNAIVTNVVSTSPSQTRSENAGKVESHGLEVDARYAPSASLALFANLTRTQSTVSAPGNADQDGSATPFSPALMANLGMNARLPGRISIAPTLQWVGRYYDSASQSGRQAYGQFAIVNLRVVHQWQAQVELFADLNNLGDRRYAMPFDFRAPGFNAMAGVRWTY